LSQQSQQQLYAQPHTQRKDDGFRLQHGRFIAELYFSF